MYFVQIAALKRQLEEVGAAKNGEVEELKATVAKTEEQLEKLKEFVRTQDKQCDELAVSTLFFVGVYYDSYYQQMSLESCKIFDERS